LIDAVTRAAQSILGLGLGYWVIGVFLADWDWDWGLGFEGWVIGLVIGYFRLFNYYLLRESLL
jgi:hypothetical protein